MSGRARFSTADDPGCARRHGGAHPVRQAASVSAGAAVRSMARQPAEVGRPAMSIKSLTATLMPLWPIGVRVMKVVEAFLGIGVI